MSVETFPATPAGGETTVLTGSARDVTAEASLGLMWDEGRKAGYADGYAKAQNQAATRIEAARKEGIQTGIRQEKARRKARKLEKAQSARYNEGNY